LFSPNLRIGPPEPPEDEEEEEEEEEEDDDDPPTPFLSLHTSGVTRRACFSWHLSQTIVERAKGKEVMKMME